jgi:hypothetical protein
MKKTYIPIVCLLIFLFLVPTCIPVHASGSNEVTTSIENHLTDVIRGVKIDFTPPSIVQEAGSYFILNITLTHMKIRPRPIVFSLSVYLNLKNEYGWDHTVKIGSKPFVFLTRGKSITVAVPCFTRHNLGMNINAMFAEKVFPFNLSKARIGVKIDNIFAWVGQDLLWKFLVTDKINAKQWSEWTPQEAEQFISSLELLSNVWKNAGGLAKIRVLSGFSILANLLRPHNPLIVWKNTSILPAFACCSKIRMTANISNKTEQNGRFNVTVKVTNDLPINASLLILVDMSDQTFANTLFPALRGLTLYNLGSLNNTIKKNETKTWVINCSFPGKGFDRKLYNISVEFCPFIPINNSSLYGVFFYNFRWKMLIKPYYVVNATVTNLIQEFWFNAPIFWEEPTLKQIFQTNRSQILYTGKTSTDIMFNQITNGLFERPLLLFLIIFLIGAPYVLIVLLIYVIVQKRIRKKQ